jgi:predicted enzyme related to lactoylglutathione lyase
MTWHGGGRPGHSSRALVRTQSGERRLQAGKHADESARLAAELGATICVPLQDIPAVGRFCGIVSPQGVMFYVIAYRS